MNNIPKLEKIIKENGFVQDGEKFQVVTLKGDASTRRYYRVKLSQTSLIAAKASPENKLEIENFIFWNERYLQAKVQVPKIVSQIENYIFQEDLGDRSLYQEAKSEDIYKKVITELIKIQSMPIPTSREMNRFDEKKFQFEFSVTKENYLEGSLGLKPSEILAIEKIFKQIHSALVPHKYCVTHRDFHSKNIILFNSSPYLVDFQDTMLGLPQYDLASILEDCYTNLASDLKLRLKTSYWERTQEIGFYLYEDIETFNLLYDLSACQRLFKAIGSFCMINLKKQNSSYLKYVNPSIVKMKEISLKYDFTRNLCHFLKELT